jgi:chaperonin GroES
MTVSLSAASKATSAPRAASSSPTPPRKSRQEGEVIATGPGARDENGKVTAARRQAGDRVLFGKWSGTEVKLDGEDLLIMKESDIMGIVAKPAPPVNRRLITAGKWGSPGRTKMSAKEVKFGRSARAHAARRRHSR